MGGGFEILLWALLIIASVTDLIWGKIFNSVTFPFLILGVISRFAVGGMKMGTDSLLGVLVAFALFFPLYRMRALAAADVKLLMAFGAWTDVMTVIRMAVVSILIGAAVGLILLLKQIGLKASAESIARHLKQRTEQLRSHRMPFAPAFLCAFFVLKIAEHYRWSVL